jgi:hypothetical protein
MRFRLPLAFVLSILAAQATSPAKAQQAAQNHAATWGTMFQSQVGRCWKQLDGVKDGPRTDVVFAIKLKPDGTLDGSPVPDQKTAASQPHTLLDNAVRAIIQCQPYKLPAEYYDEWKYFAPVFVYGQIIHR